LQCPSGHTDDLSDLISTLSPLYEVADLLYPFWSKLRGSSTIDGLRFELNGTDHFFKLLFSLSRAPSLTENVRALRVTTYPPLDPSTDKLSIERLSGL